MIREDELAEIEGRASNARQEDIHKLIAHIRSSQPAPVDPEVVSADAEMIPEPALIVADEDISEYR